MTIKDPVVKKIYREFDNAEKAIKKDIMDQAIINLYKNIHDRTIQGEFTKDQLALIQIRAQESLQLIEDIKKDLQKSAIDNSNRHKNLQNYLKNSF